MGQLAIKDQSLFYQNKYPSLVKYMGSKSKIMDFVLDGINQVYSGGAICDLFSGSASLAGALGQQCTVHSNDIQNYSRILSDTYNNAYLTKDTPDANEIINQARIIVNRNKNLELSIDYEVNMSLKEFQKIEEEYKNLINFSFRNKWHLFVKNYSGTWWSYNQCLWIDAIRQVAEKYKSEPFYPVIISSLMFAMAYASQGTGHYAQYRDAKAGASLKDIISYRRRSIEDFFIRKYKELLDYIPESKILLPHKSTSLDYRDCLDSFEGGTVYADPPYCFVHYSRFYHALETLVLYDYPKIQEQKGSIVKGRYREDRHQSPFCIKTQVEEAFISLLEGVDNSDSNLVLSYSNTGMMLVEDITSLLEEVFPDRKKELLTIDYKHMTLGRKNDHYRDVKECLFLVY